MWNATQALTILAEIDPAHRHELDAQLAAIAADLAGNPVFRPGALPDTHFTRFVILEDNEFPPLLAWESNHDGATADYLARVARTTPEIDRVLAACRDYPGIADIPAWVAWMRARSYRAAAFYTAYRGVPRKQIVNDRAVHDALSTIADRQRATLGELSPPALRDHLADELADSPLDTSPQDDGALRWLVVKTLAITALIVVLPVILVGFVPWYLTLRRREQSDPAATTDRPVHDDRDMHAFEDKVTQNQLTHLVDLKPGSFRLATAFIVLTAIDVLARGWYVSGDLGGITSIHFARWVIVRDTRTLPRGTPRRHRLLFFSNYDGSWESYLGEFIDRAAPWLTAVWSNTVDFPRTEQLINAGARDEEAFKQWTRDHQVATQVWWSGVPDSTVQNVCDDIYLRRGLRAALADDEVPTWLRTL